MESFSNLCHWQVLCVSSILSHKIQKNWNWPRNCYLDMNQKTLIENTFLVDLLWYKLSKPIPIPTHLEWEGVLSIWMASWNLLFGSKNFELPAMYVLWSSLGLFPSRTDCLTATRGSFESFLPTSSSNVSLRTEDTWKTRKVGGPCPHPLTTALPQKTPLTISTILYQWIRTEDGELS